MEKLEVADFGLQSHPEYRCDEFILRLNAALFRSHNLTFPYHAHRLVFLNRRTNSDPVLHVCLPLDLSFAEIPLLNSRDTEQSCMSHCENPCPCGFYGDVRKGCTCSMGTAELSICSARYDMQRYQDTEGAASSGPLMDRIAFAAILRSTIRLSVPR